MVRQGPSGFTREKQEVARVRTIDGSMISPPGDGSWGPRDVLGIFNYKGRALRPTGGAGKNSCAVIPSLVGIDFGRALSSNPTMPAIEGAIACW